jgi:hypothetical protein
MHQCAAIGQQTEDFHVLQGGQHQAVEILLLAPFGRSRLDEKLVGHHAVLAVHHRLVGDKAQGWRQLVDRLRLGTVFDRRGFQFFFNSGDLVSRTLFVFFSRPAKPPIRFLNMVCSLLMPGCHTASIQSS